MPRAVGDALHLSNAASKGKRGGRTVPLNKELRAALIELNTVRPLCRSYRSHHPQRRNIGMSAGAVQVWFHGLYAALGFPAASSHRVGGHSSLVAPTTSSLLVAPSVTFRSLQAVPLW
jgi:integrase/recombinase XerD